MENIDKIFYINLNKRTDRKKQIDQELEKMGFDKAIIERFPAVEMGQIGCIQSHISIVKIAKERHYRNIIILEDDFHFIVSRETLDNELATFFGKKIEYYILMLSYLCYGKREWDEQLSIGINCQDASGYIVNESAYDLLIYWLSVGSFQLTQTGQHWKFMNDQIWKKMQGEDKWFLLNHKMGEQNGSVSDLANTEVHLENSKIVIKEKVNQ